MNKGTIMMLLILVVVLLCPLLVTQAPSSPKNLFNTDKYTYGAHLNTSNGYLEFRGNVGYEPKYSRFWVWGVLENRTEKNTLARVRVTLIGDSKKNELVFQDTVEAKEKKQVVLYTTKIEELATYDRCFISIEYGYYLLDKIFWSGPLDVDILEKAGVKPINRDKPMNIQILDLEY